jgi:FkbM family methyltransferase
MRILEKLLRYRKRKNVYIVNGEQISLGDHYNFEAHLEQIINTYQIDTVIDIGANEGQFGSKIRKLGFEGQICSFEPVKKVYETLEKRTTDDQKWIAYNIALGSEAGQMPINVSESSDFSSILDPNEFGSVRFRGIKVARTEMISVCRLDDFLKKTTDLKGKRILLKIDTQGYDFQVFEGAKGILDNVCAIVSELSLIPIYHGMKDYLEMLGVYQRSGFSVSGIYPVSRNKQTLSLIEVDCVLVNQNSYR